MSDKYISPVMYFLIREAIFDWTKSIQNEKCPKRNEKIQANLRSLNALSSVVNNNRYIYLIYYSFVLDISPWKI